MNEMERRALAREDEWFNLTTRELRRLKRYYETAATELIKEIEALYGRYGRENRLPPEEARRLIRGAEFRQWRMSLEEYVSRSKGDEKLLLELNTLAMRSRINRLDVLYSKTLMELGDLSERLKDFSDAFFYRSYVEHYYGTLYDVGQEIGLKTPPAELDRAKVAAVLKTNWSGRLYDERIRAQRRRYSVAIKEIVLRAVHKGESIEKLSRRLSEKMQSDYKSAELLVRTEVNYFQNRAAADALRDADFTHYQFVATLDRRTCARCGNKDGEVYSLSEMNQGENAPPLHPRCRCTIIASFGEKMTGSRISEGRKKIPAETSYKEWRAGIGEVGYNPKIRTKPLTAAEIKTIKDAEDAAYKAVTGADFGFKKRTAEAKWSEEIIYANGDGKGMGYKTNCQKCVVAHEARMRGYDVVARPSWRGDPLQKVENWLQVFEGEKETYNCKGATPAEIKNFIAEKMNEWGKGSRAFLWFDWKEPILGKSHVIVTHLNENGFVQYGDPQTGKIGVVGCLQAIKLESAVIMRVDNLSFTEELKWYCLNRRKVK